jgi:hypothetical protein
MSTAKKLEPGREMDALVAEKVMGLPLAANAQAPRGRGVDPYFRDADAEAREAWYPNGMRCRRVPRYSTESAPALDALAQVGGIVTIQRIRPDEWHVRIDQEKWWGETLPFAICRALLAVSGVQA